MSEERRYAPTGGASQAITSSLTGVEERVIDLVAREAYAGFRPTFMCEKLFELHQIKLSKETVGKVASQRKAKKRI